MKVVTILNSSLLNLTTVSIVCADCKTLLFEIGQVNQKLWSLKCTRLKTLNFNFLECQDKTPLYMSLQKCMSFSKCFYFEVKN